MTALVSLHHALFTRFERADWLLPTLARVLFAAILLVYYWNSGLTKLGDGLPGLFNPAVGAYAQIFPKAAEAVTYDITKLSLFHHAVVLAGTWAEFILPVLILAGLLARLAALGMIGFIVVQSLTDLFGHGGLAHEGTLGAWFDKAPDAIILDQRALWVFLLLVIVVKGAGPLSLDRVLSRTVAPETTSRG
ncbi:hypothetical protein A3731_27245 [Roseovarius sp. HI0049]|nr:hypothetical protein A3731_27245 [Roseovarius sp. HI0049]